VITKESLRPYQLEAFEALDSSMIDRGERSSIMALPTGSGKTLAAAVWLNERFLKNGCKVAWFVHRIELLNQARDAFRRVDPDLRITEWSADSKDDKGQVVLAMIMSARELACQFDVIVVDEAHHSAMPTYRKKLNELAKDFILGLTATPTRLDGKDLGFQSIAIQRTVLDLVAEGFLAKPIYVRIRTGQRYRMRVNHGAGDFDTRSLRQLDNGARNELIVNIWASEKERWGKTLVFCADIEHAEHLQALLQERGLRTTVVHSKLSDKERVERVEGFRAGQYQLAINVGVFTEGFDVPDLQTIIMARPTASEVLYLQMVGRGTRVTPEKDHFFVVDFVDELGKYSLLANRWAVEHLGAVDEEEKILLAQQRKDAEAAMRVRGLPEDRIREVLREFVMFAGLIEWKTQYDNGPQVRAMTEDQFVAWTKLKLMMGTRTGGIKETIEDSYAVTGAAAADMNLRDWKNLGWATFFQLSMVGTKGYVKFAQFRKVDFEEKQLKDELQESILRSSQLTAELNKPEKIGPIMGELNEVLWNVTGIPNFISQLKFRSMILSIAVPTDRDSLSGSTRATIRRVILDHAADRLGVEVNLLLRWGTSVL